MKEYTNTVTAIESEAKVNATPVAVLGAIDIPMESSGFTMEGGGVNVPPSMSVQDIAGDSAGDAAGTTEDDDEKK